MQFQGVEMSRRTVKWGCPAAAYDFTCEGQAECFKAGNVRPGSNSRHVRTKIYPDYLRNNSRLPHVSTSV